MKKLLNHLHVIGLSVLVSGSLGSCSDDDDYKTSHPDKGVIEITPQWTACEEASRELPDTYKMQAGEVLKEMEAVKACFPALFPPGTYGLAAYNEADHISVTGSVAMVERKADGSLHDAPGFLFTGQSEVTVVEDDTVRVDLPMQQHVRRLTFTISVDGDAKEIESVTGTLEGVAGSMNLWEGTLEGEASKVVFPMDHSSRTGSELSGSFRLLGIIPCGKALLSLHIGYTDGYSQEIESDVTEWLDGFEEETGTLSIAGELNIEKQPDGGFSGTITDWKKNDEYIEIENV